MAYPLLFSPLDVGPMRVKNRVVLPPHAHVMASLWGREIEVGEHLAYWRERPDVGWVDGVSSHIRNSLVPGFEPTGVGAVTGGSLRAPYFVDRVGRLAEIVHANDTRLTVQIIFQGGMPHAPSSVLSGPVINLVPHPMTRDEIEYFVEEYRDGAGHIREAGADGVEIHLNHDDLLEWFLSPLTNRRDDEYGGTFEGRLRFPARVLRAVREAAGPGLVVGVRLNLREEEPGGYDVAGAVEIARYLEAEGLVDYLSCAIGSPWGNPSYIQSHHHRPAEWSALAGTVRAAVKLPVVYSGRVTSPAVAERVLADGHADLVGMARAHFADGRLLAKARAGRDGEIRPCVGGNECISRRLTEGVRFSCAVNPATGRENQTVPVPSARRRILVVGGGPAGLETAALCAERGHDVELWEATDGLGGQLAIAAHAPAHTDYAHYLTWQEGRLRRAGVRIVLKQTATAQSVTAYGADTVVVATGGRPRRPGIPGEDQPFVYTAHEVLAKDMTVAGHVVVVAQEDHLQPLSTADHLGTHGARVTVVYGGNGPAPLVSRYLIGSVLARLDAHDTTLRYGEQVVGIQPGTVQVRNVYSNTVRTLTDVDAVVLACGATPENALFAELQTQGVAAHILGDAYAPRRLVWATRQAYDLAVTL